MGQKTRIKAMTVPTNMNIAKMLNEEILKNLSKNRKGPIC